jgi:hypothetical protein
MEERHHNADHILCVISKVYLTKDYSTWERQAAQWAAATKRPNFALPVFVEECEAPTLLAPFQALRPSWLERGRRQGETRRLLGAGRKANGTRAFPG